MTVYSLDTLLSQFGTRPLFHVQFYLLLLDLRTSFLGDRSSGLVIPFSWRIFTVCCDPHKGFIVNEAEIYVFLEFSCIFCDPVDVGNLISGSSAFYKSSLNIWNLSVHVLLKPGLKNFEHCFASVWNECSCTVVWTFFGCLSLGLEWKLTFSSLVATAEFSKFAGMFAALSQHHLLGFEIAGIPSLPIALFVVMLPKAHLSSHSRMSGSRWVITPSWLSGSWRSFLYSSSMYSCHLFWISSALLGS